MANPKQLKEQRDRLIKNIDDGFKYLLTNPNLDANFRPDVKKIYGMYRKLRLMIEIDTD